MSRLTFWQYLCLSFYIAFAFYLFSGLVVTLLNISVVLFYIGFFPQRTFVQTEGKKQHCLKKLQTFFGIGLTIVPVRTQQGKPKLRLRNWQDLQPCRQVLKCNSVSTKWSAGGRFFFRFNAMWYKNISTDLDDASSEAFTGSLRFMRLFRSLSYWV